MAATDTTAADDDEQADSPIEALTQRLAEQAEHQENFQTFLRVRSDPDADAAEQFQEDLIEFIKTKMAEEDIGVPEAAIALWEQVALMERNVRDGDGDAGEPSAMPQQGDSRDAARDDGDSDAGLPDDPAFQ
ncbi:hypothetical protein SY89_03483 [Halolamina pelagica]|uniref:Uncharacterized protein n=1 Tax=Halolamina pelagica TaxID=699431 RepID=A0A0P7GL65_9EURY|nr:hypothetical protein [Halolamina pelagica]KPN29249.1 hypothetical protein SY89_03483 [Halolamina pelagica]